MVLILNIFLLSLLVSQASYHSIEDFGAIANNNSNEAAHNNTRAITEAFAAANQDLNDRTVLLTAGKTFFFFNISGTNLSNIVLRVEGNLVFSDNITEWENIMGAQPPRINDEAHSSCLLITVNYIQLVVVTGEGLWALNHAK